MTKIFQLDSCTTCQRILKEFGDDHDAEVINIKERAVTPEELDHMAALTGSYEALFSRRAMKYRSMGLADKELTEADYRRLILEEYTFLKRPVVVSDNQIFVGNSKAAVAGGRSLLRGE